MKKLTSPLLAAGLIAAPLGASGQDLSYNYIQGAAAFYPSFENQDFIGVDVRGSVSLMEDFFVFGGMQFLTDDIDLTTVHAGVGYRQPLMDRTDVWGGVTLEYQEFESEFVDPGTGQTLISASEDETSVGFRAGVRHLLTDEFEVAGEARYVTGDLDYFGIKGTAQYFLNEQVGLIGELDLYDGELGAIVGGRLSF